MTSSIINILYQPCDEINMVSKDFYSRITVPRCILEKDVAWLSSSTEAFGRMVMVNFSPLQNTN